MKPKKKKQKKTKTKNKKKKKNTTQNKQFFSPYNLSTTSPNEVKKNEHPRGGGVRGSFFFCTKKNRVLGPN